MMAGAALGTHRFEPGVEFVPSRAAIRPGVEMSAIRKTLGGRQVLAGIDLTIEPGEAVALTGPNGVGKTTLLRIVATLSRPDSGTLRVHGVDALADPPAARAALGLVPQEPSLDASLTALDHAHFVAATAPAGRRPDLDSWLDAETQTMPCRTLSRGQRQRLSWALATSQDPPLLLLDEAFAALDAAAQAQALALVSARGSRQSVLWVTHGDETRNCDRILALDRHGLREKR